jgi:hydroxyacylglutathione hydrolase
MLEDWSNESRKEEAMAAEIHVFRCLQDNIGALIRDSATGACAAVDAPEEAAVVAALEEKGWSLTDIIVTHSHWDHVQGIEGLKSRYGCRVVAPAKASEIADIADTTVSEGDTIMIGEMAAKVWETPGHCADHVVYWFEADKLLVAGDVLFVMGCGRVFGDDYGGLWQALKRVRELPDDTVAVVGHDYTLANAHFALKADRGNAVLQDRVHQAEAAAKQKRLWGLTTIGEEKATNPFLRGREPEIAASVELQGAPEDVVFRALREWKNKG